MFENLTQKNFDQSLSEKSSFSKVSFYLVFIVLLIIHTLLAFWFEPPSVVLSDEPTSWLDYDTHAGQVHKVTEALDKWGKAWAYDPQLIAGNLVGAMMDADAKGWELWTYVLWKCGLTKGLAYNLFILFAYLALPFVVFVSARLFDLDKWTSLLAVALGMCVWYFDAYPRWCAWVGMISWAFAGYLFLLPLSLFYRYAKSKNWIYIVLFGIVLCAGHLIHPFIFGTLVVPVSIIYVQSFKSFSRPQHGAIIVAALATVLANLYWIITALKFTPYVVVIDAEYGKSDLSFLLSDYLGLIQEPMVSGYVGNRTFFRTLVFIASAIGLYEWKKQKDNRFIPFFSGLLVMLVLTYVAGHIEAVAHTIKPYRNILPAMLFCILPGAHFLSRAYVKARSDKNFETGTYIIVALTLVATASLARDVLYYFPSLFKEQQRLSIENPVIFAHQNVHQSITPIRRMDFRHQPTFEDIDHLAKWIRKNDDGDGRILVESWIIAEHLSWSTNAQILGGFLERPFEHAQANLFNRNIDGALPKDQFKKYLEDYAVKWVIVTHQKPKLEKNYLDLLEPLGHIPLPGNPKVPIHRIYKTKIPVSFFAQNTGKITPSLNTLKVTGTQPNEDVVLRFHWLDSFVCKTKCNIIREPVEHDSVGFIRVLAPHPSDFTIINNY